MTNPDDPFAAPGEQPPAQPPGYGAPPPPPPPAYGAPPPPPPPAYGAPPPAYGQPAYGTPPPAYGGGPELATWGLRAGGTIIDSLIALVIYLPFFILGAAVGGGFGGLLIVLGYAGGLGFTIWNLVQQGNTGQTIGKKQVGIRLLREADGQVVGPGMSVVRIVVHFVDSLPCIPLGYLWPLWDAKKQTFTDKILGTLVVKA